MTQSGITIECRANLKRLFDAGVDSFHNKLEGISVKRGEEYSIIKQIN